MPGRPRWDSYTGTLGRSGFARRNANHVANVGQSPTYPVRTHKGLGRDKIATRARAMRPVFFNNFW